MDQQTGEDDELAGRTRMRRQMGERDNGDENPMVEQGPFRLTRRPREISLVDIVDGGKEQRLGGSAGTVGVGEKTVGIDDGRNWWIGWTRNWIAGEAE